MWADIARTTLHVKVCYRSGSCLHQSPEVGAAAEAVRGWLIRCPRAANLPTWLVVGSKRSKHHQVQATSVHRKFRDAAFCRVMNRSLAHYTHIHTFSLRPLPLPMRVRCRRCYPPSPPVFEPSSPPSHTRLLSPSRGPITQSLPTPQEACGHRHEARVQGAHCNVTYVRGEPVRWLWLQFSSGPIASHTCWHACMR